MKLAVLSDIHGNVFALEAVIEDALSCGVKQMVNLGDTFYGPIAPWATYELLQKHGMLATIRGNQDRQICEAAQKASRKEASPDESAAHPTMRFVLDDLGREALDWMRSLPSDCRLDDDIYMCHGSPASDLEYLLENIRAGHPRLRSDREITASLGGQRAEIILCGHTHIPRCVQLSSGQMVINPGSVGLPAYTDDEPVLHSMENYCSHASYAVLEKRASGWIVRQMKVAYDVQQAVALARERQREDWAHFLRTGRKIET